MKPIVLTISGIDPTGGAGVQADIEAVASMGSHAAPIASALTVQDTVGVKACYPVNPVHVIEQARSILEDMPVAACKLGLLPNVRIVETVHSVLIDYPDLPVVLDPVLASGRGDSLVDADVVDALRSLLIPIADVLTPNSLEARTLTVGTDNLDAAAHQLMELGARFVLITGSHEPNERVVNTLYGHGQRLESFDWPRLPNTYHGSGCTLASAIAGLLGHGMEPLGAIRRAQEYTWKSLQRGYRAGSGQLLPDRLFWATPGKVTGAC